MALDSQIFFSRPTTFSCVNFIFKGRAGIGSLRKIKNTLDSGGVREERPHLPVSFVSWGLGSCQTGALALAASQPPFVPLPDTSWVLLRLLLGKAQHLKLVPRAF